MKIKLLVLFVIFSSVLVSCNKDMKWINPDDSKADQSEIGKICEEKSAECGLIEYEYLGKMRKVFCGECNNGYDCKSNKCQDIDECADPSLNNCNNEVSICVNEEGAYSCICKENYSGDDCVPDTRTKKCENLPENAEWNTVAKITQTWNGREWTPSAKGSYNEESSKTKCRFKCLENYNWNGVNCVPMTRTAKCSELPAGTEWNTASEITQTWSGSEWLPSTASTFNEEASKTECRYKCASDLHRENSACISNTKTDVECTGLPAEHASWNIVSTITQTWTSENGWQPSSTGVYNETARTDECLFKCDANYYWDESECVNPCDYEPCDEVANSTKVCTASAWNEYACGCVSGYYWWGTERGCSDKKTLGNICTGQNQCYNKSSSITCPASPSGTDDEYNFFGQDAQYTGKCTAQSFSSSSNVVVDNNTGLTWEKSPSSSTYTWENRNSHCNELNTSNYGGKNNWRVPNPHELLTIVNNSTYNPATDSNFTGMPTEDSTYLWTNNEYKSYPNYASYFSPSYGWYTYAEKTSTYKVLCVSGNEMPKGAFSSQAINVSFVVTDSATGLMWQKNYAIDMTWQQALKYCEDLSYSGYTDWRLPNKNELASLLDPGKSSAPYSNFPDMPSKDFWSSSPSVYDTNTAWYVHFSYGSVNSRSKVNVRYVRCVR